MEILGLMLFLHFNLGALVRMLQGSRPFGVNLKTFRTFTSPWFLPNFTVVRILFLTLIVYNSFVLSINFYREVLIPYVFYYCVMIAWVRPFVKGNFNRAVQIMVVLTMFSIGMTFEKQWFAPNTIWCMYFLYVSSWYNWCLPI